MSYDRPGCACSALVKAARSVCDATTSRLSNCNKRTFYENSIECQCGFCFVCCAILSHNLPVIKLDARELAKLALKLECHRSLSLLYIVLVWQLMMKTREKLVLFFLFFFEIKPMEMLNFGLKFDVTILVTTFKM